MLVEVKAPGIIPRQSVHEPMQTGIKAIDALIPDRARPARADHRRPADRQDGGDHRHDHQPEGRQRQRRPTRRRKLYCIYVAIGQKRSTVAQLVRTLEEQGRDGIFHRRGGDRERPGADAIPGTLHRLHDGRVSSATTGCHAVIFYDDLSPSRLSPTGRCRCCCAARRGARHTRATCSTCTRACWSGRRRCPKRTARGQPDRAAGDRDAGGRRVGLHPDQRHQHHGRPDLPGDRTVLQGYPPGGERRPVRVARGFGGTDQGDEAGGRQASSSSWRSTARWRRSRSSRPTSTPVHAEAAGARGPPYRVAEAAAIQAGAGGGAGADHLRRHARVSRQHARSAGSATSSTRMLGEIKSREPGIVEIRSATTARSRRRRRPSSSRSSTGS